MRVTRESRFEVRGSAIVAAVQGCDEWRPLTMIDGNGLAEKLLGLAGLRVLDVVETPES